MKKILLIISLIFVSFIYAQQQQEASLLRLDRDGTVYFDDNSIGKQEYAYDANEKETLFIESYWDTTTQSFGRVYKYETTYDANSNLLLTTNYFRNTTTQSFVLGGKEEYTCNTNGKVTFSIYYSWNTTTQSFVPSSKAEFTYDANENPTIFIYYSWDNTTQSFVPSSKQESTFDTNGNQTLLIDYFWDTYTQSFVLIWKSEYTYDANGNKTLRIDSDSHTPRYKYEYTYDSNDKQILEIMYYWDTNSQSYVPESKVEKTYSNGLLVSFLTQSIIYKWYAQLGVYKPSFKTEYATILDTATQLNRIGVPYQYDIDFNVWNLIPGEEVKSYEYYTKTASLSTQTIENNLLSLYPNPSSQVLYVSHPDLNSNSLGIQIVDLNGKQMYSGTIQKNVPLDVSTYTPGMYLVTIENRETNKKNTYKIIKK